MLFFQLNRTSKVEGNLRRARVGWNDGYIGDSDADEYLSSKEVWSERVLYPNFDEKLEESDMDRSQDATEVLNFDSLVLDDLTIGVTPDTTMVLEDLKPFSEYLVCVAADNGFGSSEETCDTLTTPEDGGWMGTNVRFTSDLIGRFFTGPISRSIEGLSHVQGISSRESSRRKLNRIYSLIGTPDMVD